MAEQIFLELFKSVDQQMHSLNTTMGAQGIARVVQTFDGSNTKDFKEWVKSIEKFATLTGIDANRTNLVAYQSSKGPVSDFIKRYMESHPGRDWGRMKVDLRSSFGEVVDSQHALLLLRKVKQRQNEMIQVYAERLIALGDDAFEDQPYDAVQKQLVGCFIDGLNRDSMKLRIMRDNPATHNEAILIATREQNLQKRFSLRTGQSKFESNESEGRVPMDIDHSRRKSTCHFCRKPGHHIKDCRLRKRTHDIHSAEVGSKLRHRDKQCYRCGKMGHIARD